MGLFFALGVGAILLGLATGLGDFWEPISIKDVASIMLLYLGAILIAISLKGK